MGSVRQLWRVSVTATCEAEDAVAEMLGATLGQPASSHFDFETGTTTVTAYVQGRSRPTAKVRNEILAGLKRIKECGLTIGAGRLSIVKVRREDWAESWKRHFKPIEITSHPRRDGFNRRDELYESPISFLKSRARITRPSENSLLIRPSWSKRKARRGQAVVVLDPGLSFGTGQHPTTAFCLQEIVRHSMGRARSPQRAAPGSSANRRHPTHPFLDIGTGSGILAIAAATLGYAPVHAIDFDPEAVRIARANAQTNGVAGKLRIGLGDVTKLPLRPSRRYDLICANLISTLLIAERRRITTQLNHGGTLVLAGILSSEFGQVQKAFERLGLRCVASRREKEWRSGAFVFTQKSGRRERA